MADLWPSTLPQCFLADTVSWQLGEARLRSTMEAGPVKVRRRSSAVSDRLAGNMKLTVAQWDALKYFVKTTLQDGDPFIFPNPDGGTALLVRFGDSEPGAVRIGRGYWVASLELEVLPQ